MTLSDLEKELRRRGVLGLHVSLVGAQVTITAVTSETDAIVIDSDLAIAFRRLLTRLEVSDHV